MNIYVGNLTYKMTEEELNKEFAAFGAVTSARIIKDKGTGQSKGFGFVEMSNDAEARAAIDGLNGKNLGGRPLKLNEARPRTEDAPRSGGKRDRGGYNRER